MNYEIAVKKLNNLVKKINSRDGMTRDEKKGILEILRARFIALTFQKNGFTTAHWNTIDAQVCEELRKLV
jgi:hypothetical protein